MEYFFLIQISGNAIELELAAERDLHPFPADRQFVFRLQPCFPTMDVALSVYGFKSVESNRLWENWCIILRIRELRHQVVDVLSPKFAGGDSSFRSIELAIVIKFEMLLIHQESAHSHGVPVNSGDQL